MTGVGICTLVGATRIIPGAFQKGMGAGGITIRHRALSIWRCTILTSITLSNSFTTIGHYAFDNWVMLVRK